MGWLSLREAPGFASWGEKRVKDFMNRTGLSSSLETGARRRNTSRARDLDREERIQEDRRLSTEEEASLEVDVQSLFTIGWVMLWGTWYIFCPIRFADVFIIARRDSLHCLLRNETKFWRTWR